MMDKTTKGFVIAACSVVIAIGLVPALRIGKANLDWLWMQVEWQLKPAAYRQWSECRVAAGWEWIDKRTGQSDEYRLAYIEEQCGAEPGGR